MVRTSFRSSVSVIQVVDHVDVGEPADYKKALSATGFGLYNFFLVLATIPVAWASAFNMTTSAFILASAECELELTFIRKGLLVSVVYIGMMMSSLFWGFLSDRLHRRPLFLLGLLIDILCNILCTLVDSYYIFLLLKFITGTIVNGPLANLVPYLNEFQPQEYRAKVVTWSGYIFSFGFVVPAVLAFTVTPLPWSFILFGRSYNAWRIYLLLCCIPSIIGFVTMSFLPESPKSLMENGYIPRAYYLLSQMYAVNNRVAADTYPIKMLQTPTKIIEEPDVKSTTKRILNTWHDIEQLYAQPHLGSFLIINFLQLSSMLAFNTMRLWIPHMFIIINNFDYTLWDSVRGNPTICEYLIPGIIPPGLNNETFYANHACIRWHINPSVYINSSIIATSAVSFSFFISFFYTTRLRKQIVIALAYLIGILGCWGTNWGQLVPLMLTLSAAIVVTARTASNIVIATNTDVIPVQLRPTSSNILGHMGSLGTIVGNIIFSILLGINCLSAFMALGGLLTLCLIMSFFILRPKCDKMDTAPS